MPDSPRAFLLLTRPERDSHAFLETLEVPAGVETIISPLLEIVPTGALPAEPVSGVIFTSANGVAAWTALGGETALPAFVVGPATAATARAAGFDARSAEGDADDLVALIRARPPAGPLLHVRGAHARGDVARRLTDAGIPTRETVLYDQKTRALAEIAKNALSEGLPIIVALFSARTAAHFALCSLPKDAVHAVVISDRVADALGRAGVGAITVAAAPNGSEMTRAVQQVLARLAMLESG